MPRPATLCRLARIRGRAHRHIGQCRGMPIDASRGRSEFDQPDLFSVSRTSGHGSLLPGTSRLPTFVLSRCTLFLDGLALRYQRPFAL